MDEGEAIVQAIRATPDDTTARLVYADWLEEQGHPGAAYLRAEVALARAPEGETAEHRRALLERIPKLPWDWRQRFEQPDLLLAPPVPFSLGWYSENAGAPEPYRSLPNLDPAMLTPDLPWLSDEGFEPRVDQDQHEREELAALAQLQDRAAELGLILPPGVETFARDFPRCQNVSRTSSYCEVCLHDAVVEEFQRVGEGYLIIFFCDMNYGNRHQTTWSLYLVPKIDWHCVVVYELPDDSRQIIPDGPQEIFYCAPSFQAFLYRWWLEGRAREQSE